MALDILSRIVDHVNFYINRPIGVGRFRILGGGGGKVKHIVGNKGGGQIPSMNMTS